MLMSTAKKINEAPVIDIGTDTQLLAIGADGKVGKWKFPALVQQSKEKGFPFVEQGDWWRIANIDACGVGILCIRERWSQSAPTPVVLGIAVDAYPGGPQVNADAIKVLAGRSNRITKVRVVIDAFNKANACWIDVCVPHADIYKYRATQVAALGLGIKPVEIAEAPSVDSAYQVREYDMATLTQSGGVICCTSVGPYRVAVAQKGGPHEYR